MLFMITEDFVKDLWNQAGFEEISDGFYQISDDRLTTAGINKDINLLERYGITSITSQPQPITSNMSSLILPIALIGGAMLLLK